VTVNTLPNDIFLEIFSFYLSSYPGRHGYLPYHAHTIAWQILVQVCQRWRDVIYGSPCYLDLHLPCSYDTHFRKNFGRWPEFPLTLHYSIDDNMDDNDDAIAALEHPDRVHHANLAIRASSDSAVVDNILAAMQVPFPALTHLDFARPDPKDEVYCYLDIQPYYEVEEIFVPDEFLGGFAPRLQRLYLGAVYFPALPKLLLSARDLVSLELERIGYVSPEAMVGGLAGLTKLSTLHIKFHSDDPPYSDENSRRPDLPIHALLPALNEFAFRGSSWYLEDLVAQIDAPGVKVIEIEYLSLEIEAGQLLQLIGRTRTFKFAQFRHAQLTFCFHRNDVSLVFDRPQGECLQHLFHLTVSLVDRELDHLVPCMIRVLRQFVAMLSDVGQLFIEDERYDPEEERYLDDIEWLPLLRLFPAVKALDVTGLVTPYIAEEFQNIAEESIMEVLPALHSLWLDGEELTGSRFLSLRQLSGRPVNVAQVQDEFK
jgi:hypothetical protein